jgi:5-(carboxyamino)imidazole ribonucleotide synthase
MIGAGQLARMTHGAAIDLGVELRVLAARPDDAAVRAGAPHRVGSPDDLDALRALAEGCDAVTLDHELVPQEHLRALAAAGVALRPGPDAARLGQDKLHARRALGELGLPVPAFAPAEDAAAIERFAAERGWPVVLKAARGGYDGRGVWVLADREDARRAVAEARGAPLVVEEHVALDAEVAALVARRPSGEAVAWPVVETVQHDGMLRELVAPAPLHPALAARARALALRVAEAAGVTGVMAVELFVAGGELLVNELALRPHNSGHWTIEGAATSQFHNHLRAVLDWPLGGTEARAAAVATVNVVGPADGSDPAARVAAALDVPGACVHLYGKRPAPGRKLGHVTALGETAAAALDVARAAAARLEGR